MTNDSNHYTIVVIGTGFGGTMTALSLAHKLKENERKNITILMLERGTWWTTPVGTVQDPKVATYDFLANPNRNNQPVQYWPAKNSFKGFIDIATRCFRQEGKNRGGLYDLSVLGWKLPLSLFRSGDGVTILRANGVGGGSLVYSNITIRPPDLIFNDPRWRPLSWSEEKRNYYYNLARHAIGYGVISALKAARNNNIPYVGENPPPDPNINAGLSNIVTRSARLEPHWKVKDDPLNSRGIKQIDTNSPQNPVDAFWIDRARVFQTAVEQLIKDNEEQLASTSDFGAVDLAINDLTPEGTPIGPDKPPPNYPPGGLVKNAINYCERQGRCNVGCLPGARHTLNKQLIRAVYGTFAGAPALFDNLTVKALAEVDFIEELEGGGYKIHYDHYEHQDGGWPGRKTRMTVTADKVIVAAGTMGTNEIMLRSKRKEGLSHLSDKVGYGFSTNGDYIAFMERTAEPVRLTRGPVTTSFAHFNTKDTGEDSDPGKPKFHTLEDQGIPPAFASLVGFGLPVIRSLSKGRNRHLFLIWTILWLVRKRGWQLIKAPFVNYRKRQEIFKSEDEHSASMMCVVGIGREAAVGQFRLGGFGQTALRVKRMDGKKRFYEDPVYKDIKKSLEGLEPHLRAQDAEDVEGKFVNPFLTNIFYKRKFLRRFLGGFGADSITSSHPLGGCRIAENVGHGVVDEYGHVFDKRKEGQARPFYEGLYIADGSIIPTALGVNPSLTISTLALRTADKIIEELDQGAG